MVGAARLRGRDSKLTVGAVEVVAEVAEGRRSGTRERFEVKSGLPSNLQLLHRQSHSKMALRQRRGAGPLPSAPPSAPTSSSSRPTSSSSTRPPAGRPSRTKILLVGLPLLTLWYLVFSRRLTSSTASQLPPHFAVCSPSSRALEGIITMDESTSTSLRTQCVVLNDGVVVGTGSLKEVREEWGDLETLGSKTGKVKGGCKIYYLKEGQTMLPGLIDAHAHVLAYGESKSAVDLVGATSVKGAFTSPFHAPCGPRTDYISHRRRRAYRQLRREGPGTTNRPGQVHSWTRLGSDTVHRHGWRFPDCCTSLA